MLKCEAFAKVCACKSLAAGRSSALSGASYQADFGKSFRTMMVSTHQDRESSKIFTEEN